MKPPAKIESAADPFSDQARKINEVIDALAPVLNAEGSGFLEIKKSGTNWVFSYTPKPVQPAPDPFNLIDMSDEEGLKVGVAPGTVNDVVPTLGGVALDSATPPTETITATTYFWIKCVGTFGSPDSYAFTVESNTTGTIPTGTTITATGFVSFLSLGNAVVDSGDITSITSARDSNLGVESYGNVNLWWKV